MTWCSAMEMRILIHTELQYTKQTNNCVSDMLQTSKLANWSSKLSQESSGGYLPKV
jgi:hypothetical protein